MNGFPFRVKTLRDLCCCFFNSGVLCVDKLFPETIVGRDRMVVGFTTTLQSVPVTTYVVSSNPTQVFDTTLCDKVCQ